MASLLPVDEFCAVFVFKFAADYEDEVYDPADSENSGRAEPDKACADFSDIKSVETEFTEKNTEKGSCETAFG
jgi:hypothetical protein